MRMDEGEIMSVSGWIEYGQMLLSVEQVTPAIATRWLEQNEGNRRIRQHIVEQYTRDMNAECWERKPVAICFDEEGKLGNGQHTLKALVSSGKSQEFLVARNVPRKAIAIMDRGVQRTLADVSLFLGHDFDTRRAAVARLMLYGPTAAQTGKSFDELFEAYQQHRSVIDFVCGGRKKTAGVNAPMLAVCAKAAYSHDRARILRFIDIMETGMIRGEHESAAIRLRDFARSLRGGQGASQRTETYRRTMSALSHFLKGAPMTKLYGTTADLFPVPVSTEETT